MAEPVRRLRADEGELLRRVRLRALAESPRAFGATLADEAALPDEEWQRRAAAGAAGDEQIVFLALDGVGAPLGMAGGRWFDEHREVVALWGMWLEPTARGTGLAASLVQAVSDWAAARGARRLRLGVVSDGAGAIRFYERLGFVREGDERPMRRDPGQLWFEMFRDV